MKISKNATATIKPAKAVLTPFAMAGMSEDLYQASVNYKPENRFPLINFFLCAASIELGLKSAILSLDCSKDNKKSIKKLGHDLDQVLDCFQEKFAHDLFTKRERKMIATVNNYYKDKGLEYFTLPVLASSLRAFKDFPEPNDFIVLTKRVNAFLILNRYFIESQTTDETGGGLINFY